LRISDLRLQYKIWGSKWRSDKPNQLLILIRLIRLIRQQSASDIYFYFNILADIPDYSSFH